MRHITIPADIMRKAVAMRDGIRSCFAVKVDWPELQLTEDQQAANAMARLCGCDVPYPDHSVFSIEMERVDGDN